MSFRKIFLAEWRKPEQQKEGSNSCKNMLMAFQVVGGGGLPKRNSQGNFKSSVVCVLLPLENAHMEDVVNELTTLLL
jgi:hypothetical protein